jgi:hypothetical protein
MENGLKRSSPDSETDCMNGVREELAQQIGEPPAPGADLFLRLECCAVDLPSRVLEVPRPDGSGAQLVRAWITTPIHICGRPELGSRFIATWRGKTCFARATGTVELQQQRPRRWLLQFDSAIARIDVEERLPDDSPGSLDLGFTRLPARIVDRSYHGVGCVVPALAPMEPGQRVSVVVGDHKRAGTIARVRGFGNQVRVGIQLDEL